MKKLVRWLKRLWLLANPDTVQVKCPTCGDLIDAHEKHYCPSNAIRMVVLIREKGDR